MLRVGEAALAAAMLGWASTAAMGLDGCRGAAKAAEHADTAGLSPARSPAGSARGAAADTAQAGEVKVNQFMTYDPATKTVHVQLTAALGSANGGMNFNGGARGNQTITVPEGWHVIMDFVNKDAIPHSAIVLPNDLHFPAQPQNPAIPRAYTNDVTAGLPTDGTDTMDFKASKAGDYLIACGVPGHAPSGMYIKFVVSPSAKAPTYQM
ncbi:MAG TPA: sulfocyanin-like copper-binding protein [Gemmatimonadaceae bacterium]